MREHVLRTLAELDGGIEHPFGLPTGYELFYEANTTLLKLSLALLVGIPSGECLNPKNSVVVSHQVRQILF
jgi:hypothetical protein